MCFHLGMTQEYIWDFGTDKQRTTTPRESHDIHEEIHNEIVKNDRELIMEHRVYICIMLFNLMIINLCR